MDGQKEPFENGLITKEEMFFCREDVFNLLRKAGVDPTKAFFMVEKLRKGKKLDKEQESLLNNCDLKDIVKANIRRIKYLFPNAHSNSYTTQAMQIQWYHIYKPEAFYPVILTQYGSDVSDFDYDEVCECRSVEELKRIQKSYKIGQNQKTAIKFKTRLSDIIWEAKLRGFELKKPNFNSAAKDFKIDPKNPKIILAPMTSLSGVGEASANNAVASIIEDGGITSYQDLITRKYNGKMVFGKKILEGFGLYELSERDIEIFNQELSK